MADVIFPSYLSILGGTIYGALTVTGDLTVQGSLNFGDVGTDILTIAGYMQGSASGTTYLRVGNSTTSHALAATNDLLVSGKLEIDGATFVDGALTASAGGSLTGTWTDLGSVTTVDINGGTVDGAAIGSSSASTGAFTTITGTSIAFGGGTALNSYVEGTFTPTVTLVGGAGNTVPQYTTNEGRYVRIGRTVWVSIVLIGDGGNEGAGTGSLTVALPISASATPTNKTIPCGRITNGTTLNLAYAAVQGGSATFVVQRQDTISTVTTCTGVEQNNTTRAMVFAFFYEV